MSRIFNQIHLRAHALRALRFGFGLMALAAVASAAPILDQDNWLAFNPGMQSSSVVGPGCCGSNVEVAQTFAAGMDGFLESVHLQITSYPSNPPSSPLHVGIYGVSSGGTPQLDQLLAQVTVTAGTDIQTARVIANFSAFNLELTAGQTYAIVAFLPTEIDGVPVTGPYDWYSGETRQNSYAGGTSFFRNPFFGVTTFLPYSPSADLGFQTYMVNPEDVVPTPEPSTSVLVSMAAALLIWRRRRPANL
jgi:hypothetical protein